MTSVHPRCLLCALALASGCDETEETGTPPSLDAFTLDAADVVVGAPSTLRGTLELTDPDGDVTEAELTLLEPSGAEGTMATPIAGVEGRTEATVGLQVTVLAPVVGIYEVTGVLLDAEGNASEPVTSAFEVESNGVDGARRPKQPSPCRLRCNMVGAGVATKSWP